MPGNMTQRSFVNDRYIQGSERVTRALAATPCPWPPATHLSWSHWCTRACCSAPSPLQLRLLNQPKKQTSASTNPVHLHLSVQSLQRWRHRCRRGCPPCCCWRARLSLPQRRPTTRAWPTACMSAAGCMRAAGALCSSSALPALRPGHHHHQRHRHSMSSAAHLPHPPQPTRTTPALPMRRSRHSQVRESRTAAWSCCYHSPGMITHLDLCNA